MLTSPPYWQALYASKLSILPCSPCWQALHTGKLSMLASFPCCQALRVAKFSELPDFSYNITRSTIPSLSIIQYLKLLAIWGYGDIISYVAYTPRWHGSVAKLASSDRLHVDRMLDLAISDPLLSSDRQPAFDPRGTYSRLIWPFLFASIQVSDVSIHAKRGTTYTCIPG